MKKIFAEIGFGNDSFFSTEVEDGNGEYRIPGFLIPSRIDDYYIRIWLFKKVFIIFTEDGFKVKKRDKNKFKVLFGVSGDYYKSMKTILVDAINTFVIRGEGIFQEMLDLLEKYQNRKIILTNADDEQMERLGLNNMPYEVFTLKHNPDKIDSRYYEKMLEYFKLDKDDVVYFEHNEDAVKSAQSIGINTYHYDEDKKDLESLKMFLDENL